MIHEARLLQWYLKNFTAPRRVSGTIYNTDAVLTDGFTFVHRLTNLSGTMFPVYVSTPDKYLQVLSGVVDMIPAPESKEGIFEIVDWLTENNFYPANIKLEGDCILKELVADNWECYSCSKYPDIVALILTEGNEQLSFLVPAGLLSLLEV